MLELTLDLHGKTHPEAAEEVKASLLSTSSNSFEIHIITGNSDAMRKIVTDICEEYKFDYYVPYYNTGMIIVTYFK